MIPTSPTWYDRLPKVELHLHLEGALPITALWELVQKYGAESGLNSLDDLRRRFVFRDFVHFIDTWNWKDQFLREYEDFTFMAEATARDLAAQNVRYAEIFYSPINFSRRGLRVQPMTEAIRAGLDKVPQIQVALVLDLVRNTPVDVAARTLAEVDEVRAEGVIGIGLGGLEKEYPPELFKPIYQQAHNLGFHTTAHAGEAAGAESIWGALRSLQVERIGHGTRAGEDPVLIDYLRAKQIPLEMCPISNVCTGVVSSIEEHPIRRYFNQGLLLTVSTDDPTMFNNSLAEEYRLLVEKLNFTQDDVRELILNGVRVSWLTEEQKSALAAELQNDLAWNIA